MNVYALLSICRIGAYNYIREGGGGVGISVTDLCCDWDNTLVLRRAGVCFVLPECWRARVAILSG